jgi:hypothetical protein
LKYKPTSVANLLSFAMVLSLLGYLPVGSLLSLANAQGAKREKATTRKKAALAARLHRAHQDRAGTRSIAV